MWLIQHSSLVKLASLYVAFSIQEETVSILSAVSLNNLITAVTDSYELKILCTSTKRVFLPRFS